MTGSPEKQGKNKRDGRGRFKKGASGNPAGRPRSESAALREKLSGHADEIADALMEKVREGDTTAMRIALDRIVPPLKASAQTVTIEGKGDTLSDKAGSVYQASASGEMPPDVAAQIISSLGTMARIAEATDLEERIAKLEALNDEH